MQAGMNATLPALALIFEEAGNTLHANGTGFRSGHEPVHQSTSGRCVKIDVGKGLWYCFSCQRGGDIIAAVISLKGISYSAAIAFLKQRFGVDYTPESDPPVFTGSPVESVEPFPTEVLPAPLRRLI